MRGLTMTRKWHKKYAQNEGDKILNDLIKKMLGLSLPDDKVEIFTRGVLKNIFGQLWRDKVYVIGHTYAKPDGVRRLAAENLLVVNNPRQLLGVYLEPNDKFTSLGWRIIRSSTPVSSPIRPQLDLTVVKDSLMEFSEALPRINEQLLMPREPLKMEMIDRLLSAYDLLNTYLAKDQDAFSQDKLVAMNLAIHLGSPKTNFKKYLDYNSFIKATEEKVAMNGPAILKWYTQREHMEPLHRIAGVYSRISVIRSFLSRAIIARVRCWLILCY